MTAVITTGDEQITKKVEEITQHVDGKETIHITKMELKEQHFNPQIDKPTLVYESPSGSPINTRNSVNHSTNVSANDSAVVSRSSSAAHSRNNSSEFYMPDLSFDRNLSQRSDSWKQEQNARKRLNEEKDREDDEFITKLREEREERERKKKQVKGKLRSRKLKRESVENSEAPEVTTTPLIVPANVPPKTDVLPKVDPKPVSAPITTNANGIVIVLSTKVVAIMIVVLVVLLYLLFK